MLENYKQKMKFKRQQKALIENHHKESKESDQGSPSTVAKLRKLQITKLDGKVEHCLAFWGKFYFEIYEANLPSITKFRNLKELLEKNVRNDIDGLPSNEEGYKNAKAILEEK